VRAHGEAERAAIYDEAVAHRRWLLVVLAVLMFQLVWLLIWQLDRQLLFVLFVP
jgi:hypothetical protein